MADEVFRVIGGLASGCQMADEVINHPPHAPSGKPQPTEALTQMDRRINRLSLICQAMWELLRERTHVTDQELADKVLEVNLRAGQTNGRMSPSSVECPNCHKTTNSRRPTCIFCGVELQRRHQFEV